MLKEIQIKNFKSILDDTISLGRVNVFIGENGSGKSNILEALMFASLAETYKTIDADLLYINGIRVSKPSLILSSFNGKKQHESIVINLKFEDENLHYELAPENIEDISSKWKKKINVRAGLVEFNKNTDEQMTFDELSILLDSYANKSSVHDKLEKFLNFLSNRKANEMLNNFTIYTLNTEALRGIPEFQKSKKGIHGENLDLIINELNEEESKELKNYLYAISWLQDFFIDKNDELKQKGYKLNFSKSLLYFKDKHMAKSNNTFSSENSNEGILHVLFYLANIISSKTPTLFGIDNIETALNPHLCQHVMSEICTLSKKHNKQLLITTHNPAILDGLDLFDDEVRLFEVFRTDNGDTKTRRIQVKPSVKDKQYKLSELWTRGFLGAISEKF